MTEKNDTYETIQDNRLGVIYCPRPGGRRRWKRILRLLQESGAVFDHLQCESSADAERVAAMMVRNGYRAIVVAGGDSALNYALNGIMKTSAPAGGHPALGVIPAGYANDFARYWGLEAKNYRRAIACILTGRRRRVDVGRIRATSNEKETTSYFLNCVNIGTAASIIGLRHATFNILGSRTLSFFASAFLLLFRRMSYRLSFHVEGEDVEQKATTLCIGSAHGYGQTPSAVPYNGLIDISLAPTTQLTQIIHGLCLLASRRFLSHRGLSVWRTREIRFYDIDNAPMSIDGHLYHDQVTDLKIDIMPEEIEFFI